MAEQTESQFIKIKFADIRRILLNATPDWVTIAMGLGFEDRYIHAIRANNGNDINATVLEMLGVWERTLPNDFKFSVLIHALEVGDFHRAAGEVRDLYEEFQAIQRSSQCPDTTGLNQRSIRNAIIFVGNTRVGKSYICSKIFESCGSATRFEHIESSYSVTASLQMGTINFDGRTFTIIDSPGFFDNPTDGQTKNDGRNMCRLVNALESCQELYALVFLFTDGFTDPHKIWFDRMKDLMTETHRGQIILVQNKLSSTDARTLVRIECQIETILNHNQAFVPVSMNPTFEEVQEILWRAVTFLPCQLNKLVVPQICYEREEQDQPYEEVVAENTRDEGEMVEEIKDTSHYERRQSWDGFHGKVFGIKKGYQEWVPSQMVEKKWVTKMVTRRTIATCVNIYKVRFDGSKDLVEKRTIDTREEII